MEGYNVKQEALAIFNEALQGVIDSKILLCGNHIIKLMKVIAHNDLIGAFVKNCNKGVSYSNLIDDAISESGGKGLSLPKSQKLFIAMVSGLLYDFESGNRAIETFVATYFYSKDSDTSYRRFCTEVLIPYRDAFGNMFLKGESEEIPENKKERRFTEVFHPEAIKQSAEILTRIRTLLLANNSFNQKDRGEYIAIVDALEVALSHSEKEETRGLFIALNRLVATKKNCSAPVKELESLLKMYNII